MFELFAGMELKLLTIAANIALRDKADGTLYAIEDDAGGTQLVTLERVIAEVRKNTKTINADSSELTVRVAAAMVDAGDEPPADDAGLFSASTMLGTMFKFLRDAKTKAEISLDEHRTAADDLLERMRRDDDKV